MIVDKKKLLISLNLPNATVMTSTDEVKPMLIYGQTGDTIQMRDHTMYESPRIVVIKPLMMVTGINLRYVLKT